MGIMDKIPNKAEMEHCPLCLKKFTLVEETDKNGHVYFICTDCMISIWARDPFLGRWDQFEAVKCPTCKNTVMRFFCRSDGSCQWYCPNCKTKIEHYDEEKHGKGKEDMKDGEISII